MSEWHLVWILPSRIIPSLLFMLCYAIGGRSQKWVRRYIGPVLFTASNAILAHFLGSFSWKILVLLVFCPILTLPYSKDRERMWYVLALILAGAGCGLVLGHWHLGVLQGIIAGAVGIFYLINHPEPAVNEEGMIAFSSVFLIPFML